MTREGLNKEDEEEGGAADVERSVSTSSSRSEGERVGHTVTSNGGEGVRGGTGLAGAEKEPERGRVEEGGVESTAESGVEGLLEDIPKSAPLAPFTAFSSFSALRSLSFSLFFCLISASLKSSAKRRRWRRSGRPSNG